MFAFTELNGKLPTLEVKFPEKEKFVLAPLDGDLVRLIFVLFAAAPFVLS